MSNDDREFLCRHGKTSLEHYCDDHRDYKWVLIGEAQKRAAADFACAAMPQSAPEPSEAATGHATHIETRTVCQECGQQRGLFHKGCDGIWVEQKRTVSEWWT